MNDFFILPAPNRISTWAYHRRQSARSAVAVRLLQARNRLCNDSLTGNAGALVSMTSHGQRIAQCHLALESIAAGSVRPARLVLWLSESDRARITVQLRRLANRGLEVRFGVFPIKWIAV